MAEGAWCCTGAQPVREPFAGLSETHSAVVFFVGDRAYKLKKPVGLGFLDFRTPQARAAACRREAELNRRFAPDVYLGVLEVRDPAGQVCDHLVAMRRMPASRRLSALIQAGEPVGLVVRQVARILAAQHASAPRGPAISEQGSQHALWRRWQDNIEQTRAVRGGLLGASDVDEVQRLAWRFLAGRGHLCWKRGSTTAGSLTGTGTCWPRTSSAWRTGHGSLTAWSSTTGCDGSMGWTTPRSWLWIWNG